MKEDYQLDSIAQKKIVDSLFERSRLDWDFYIMLILSTIIVSLGLLLNNATIIIGGMLVTPLLSPLLVLALGFVVADKKVIWRSSRVLFKASLVVVGISILMTFITPSVQVQSELMSRTFINVSFLYVALAAGVAAAFAWVRPSLSDILPGVAISVAILPPLVTFGIGIAKFNSTLTLGGIRLFVGNLLGIVISAALVFAIMGFYRVKKEAVVKVQEEEKEEIKKELEKVKAKEDIIEKAENEIKDEAKIAKNQ